MKIVTGRSDYVGQWVFREIGKLWVPGVGTALGFVNDAGELVAGVAYTNFDGVNVVMDCAAVSKSRWLDRRGLWAVFSYPFEQLGVLRVTALVPESNKESRKLVEQAGFEQEAALKRAAPGGEDMLVYRVFKEDCRWLARRGVR